MSSVDASHYSLLIEWSDEDQAYIVSFPEWEATGLIGHTHGATYAEAVANGEDMLRALVAAAQLEGDPIPQPRRYVATG
jgi:predicted RNase H-like HicB family nuclease